MSQGADDLWRSPPAASSPGRARWVTASPVLEGHSAAGNARAEAVRHGTPPSDVLTSQWRGFSAGQSGAAEMGGGSQRSGGRADACLPAAADPLLGLSLEVLEAVRGVGNWNSCSSSRRSASP